jgi:hypothetical protein
MYYVVLAHISTDLPNAMAKKTKEGGFRRKIQKDA